MVEWYPHVLVISTLIPQAVDRTLNVVEFYYPEDIALFEREFVEAEQAAYLETAREDDEIAERMDAGRNALFAQGRSEVGPYQSPMEDGMQHFHEFYRREMEAAPCGNLMLPLFSTLIDDRRARRASRRIRRSSSSTSATISRSPTSWVTPQYRAAACPGRAFRAPRSRPVGAEDRTQRPAPAARARSRGRAVRPPRHRCDEAGRRIRSGQRHVRRASVVDAALARPRHVPPCSMADLPNGSAKANP